MNYESKWLLLWFELHSNSILHSVQRFRATVFDVFTSIVFNYCTARPCHDEAKDSQQSKACCAQIWFYRLKLIIVRFLSSFRQYLDYFRIIYSNSEKMVVAGCEPLICWRRSLLLLLTLPATMFACRRYCTTHHRHRLWARAHIHCCPGKTVEWMGDNKFRNRSLFIYSCHVILHILNGCSKWMNECKCQRCAVCIALHRRRHRCRRSNQAAVCVASVSAVVRQWKAHFSAALAINWIEWNWMPMSRAFDCQMIITSLFWLSHSIDIFRWNVLQLNVARAKYSRGHSNDSIIDKHRARYIYRVDLEFLALFAAELFQN